MTTAERARKRATQDRIRARYMPSVYQPQNPHYIVYNLTKHTKYTVWYNKHRDAWECTCPTNNLTQRCKHVQRVMDREERRVRTEERGR